MSPVIALVVGEALRARVARAVGRGPELLFCDDAHRLRELVATRGAMAVITQLSDRSGRDTSPAIRLLHERLPGIRVVVLHDRPRTEAERLLELGRSGVSGWIHQASRTLVLELRAAIETAAEQSAAAAIVRRVRPLVPRDLLPFFAYCATAATGQLEAEHAAREAGFAPRTLRFLLSRARLPSPQTIVRWSRALHVLWHLELAPRGIKSAVEPLAFPSAAALHQHVRRITGLSIPEIVRRGGFGYLLDRFAEELRSSGSPAAPDSGASSTGR